MISFSLHAPRSGRSPCPRPSSRRSGPAEQATLRRQAIGPLVQGPGPRRHGTIVAVLAIAAIVFGALSAQAGAQDARGGGSVRDLQEANPLDPIPEREPPRQPDGRGETRFGVEGGTLPVARTDAQLPPQSSDRVTPGPGGRTESEAPPPEAQRTSFAMVAVVALALPGIALALLWLEYGGRRGHERRRVPATRPWRRATSGVQEALARHRASRGTVAAAPVEADAQPGKAPAAIAHAPAPDGSETVQPFEAASTAASPDRGPAELDPAESDGSAAAPPDPGRAWTAEIEWGHEAGVWAFRVVASSEDEDPQVVTTSTPMPWPPASAAAIQALKDAVDALASSMTASGWTPLPPAGAWYAKRFAWLPSPDRPPADAAGHGTAR